MSHALPPAPFLYPITDRALGGAPGAVLAERLFAAGAAVVQLREKGLGDAAWLEQAVAATAAARRLERVLFVNDRVDLALLAGAHGVHLGGDDLSVRDVRALAGTRLLVGRSTHSVEEALAVAETGADYLALGPVFPSRTKPGRPALGPESIRQVRARTDRPIVAIGGIDAGRIAEVVEAGASGIAVIAAALHPVELEARLQDLLAAIEACRARASPGA